MTTGLLCKHQFVSSVWNFCRGVADVPLRETSPAAKSEDKRMFWQAMKDIELQRWLSDVNNDVRKDANQKNKLRTFRKCKTVENCKCEDYLRHVTNFRHRITLTKLRLSNHKLAIETGRYIRPYKKPEERICPICKKDVEDEIHFLTLWPTYQGRIYLNT